MEHTEVRRPPDGDADLVGYVRETAETLFWLSQDCMDLAVAERLRSIAADMRRQCPANGC